LVADHVLVVEQRILVEERGELVAELDLLGVHDAVGVDEFVDDTEQGLAVVVVEILEHLEGPELELGLDELADVLAVGDGLGEQLLDLAIDLLEHLDVVLVLALDRLEPGLGRELVALARVDPGGDDLAQVGPDERLLAEVELAVDVPAGREIEDDRFDLLLGDSGIGGELDHRCSVVPGSGWGDQPNPGSAVAWMLAGPRASRIPTRTVRITDHHAPHPCRLVGDERKGPLWGPPRAVEHHEPAPERAKRASGREADEAGSVYGRLRGLKSKGPRMREGPLTLPGLEPGIAA